MGVAVLAAAVAIPTLTRAQARANFSGRWTYDQANSGRGTAGNNPQVSFPTDLVIKQTPTEFNLETSTIRQDVITVAYKLDGSEVTVPAPSGVTIMARARMEGDKIVVDSKRSFNSPAGEIVADSREVYTVSGDRLTVEKTQTVGGVASSGKAVYNKVAS